MDLNKKQHNATQWVNDYSDVLYAYVVQRVKNSESAKDLVQETFLAAWRNVDNYNGEASVKTWLFTIIKNKIIDHYRKSSRQITEELPEGNEPLDAYFDEAEHWKESEYPKDWNIASKKVESKEFYDVLGRCKTKLQDVQNAVFSMKYIDGLESEEICKALTLSSSNYWVLMHRAKVQLRACLEKNWFVR